MVNEPLSAVFLAEWRTGRLVRRIEAWNGQPKNPTSGTVRAEIALHSVILIKDFLWCKWDFL